MKNVTQASNRRGRLILTAGLLLSTITIGLIMKLQAADNTPAPGWAGSGLVSLNARVDRTAVLQGDDGNVRLELILTARDVEGRKVSVPTDLLVVLDRSGSMQGEKLEHGLAAIRELIRQLGAKDRFALVTYSYEAELTIALQRASRLAKAGWENRLQDIYADGGTNMSQGLDVAYETLRSSRDELRAARVILISDGLANHGDASEHGLTQRAARFTQQEQVLSAVGVGLDFNEFLMSKLADAGTGNYYYVEQTSGLNQVFAKEFSASRDTVASALSVTLAPGPGVDVVDVAGYPLERKDGRVTFRPGTLFSGQERRVWVTYRVPTSGVAEFTLGSVRADYRSGGERYAVALEESVQVACVYNEEAFFAGVDKEAWETSVVEESYGRLREDVARAVSEGRLDEAKAEIDAYRQQQVRMNRRLASTLVEQNLVELGELEAQVDDSFQGANQTLKQNRFSKTTQADALKKRRGGATK